MPKHNGFVIYNGPSLIDNKPIVVIAIRTKEATRGDDQAVFEVLT